MSHVSAAQLAPGADDLRGAPRRFDRRSGAKSLAGPVDWQRAMDLVPTPVTTFPFQIEPLTQRVHRIDSGAFVLVVASEEPHVSLLAWAPSDGAALRALEQMVERDDGAEAVPPEEMSLGLSSPTAGAVENRARSGGDSAFEAADYRLSDGTFVHRSLTVGALVFCFRGLERDLSEAPYAVLYRPRSRERMDSHAG